MSRYDVDKFVPLPDQELICCICTNVLDEPMECPCRHVFCKVCIETWLNNKSNCPSCRDHVEKQDLRTVLPLVRNMLNKLTLMCLFVDNGCQDMITLEKYPGHVEECGYEIVECKYAKCSQRMLRKLIGIHEEHQCLHREILCTKQCELRIPLTDIDSHDCLQALKSHCEAKNKQISVLQTELSVARNQFSQLQKEVEKLKKDLRSRRLSWDSSSTTLDSSDGSLLSQSSRDRSRTISPSPARSLSASPARSLSHDSFPLPHVERDEQEAILNSIAMEQTGNNSLLAQLLAVSHLTEDEDGDEERDEDQRIPSLPSLQCNTCLSEVENCSCPLNVEREIIRVSQDDPATGDESHDSGSHERLVNSETTPEQYFPVSSHDSPSDTHTYGTDTSNYDGGSHDRSLTPDSRYSNSGRDSHHSDYTNHSEHDEDGHHGSRSDSDHENLVRRRAKSSSDPDNHSDNSASDSSCNHGDRRRKRKRSRSSESSFSSRSEHDCSDSDNKYSSKSSREFRRRVSCHGNKKLRSRVESTGASTSCSGFRNFRRSSPSSAEEYRHSDERLSLQEELLSLNESDRSSGSDRRTETSGSEESSSEGSHRSHGSSRSRRRRRKRRRRS